MYALLAAAYRYPSSEGCEAVSSGQFQGHVRKAAAGLPYPLPIDGAALAPPGPAPTTLQGAYAHLFDVGSVGGPPCSLYEGEYRGNRLGVMEDLLRFHRFFGLRRAPEVHERPDHLAVELEFLHWLTFQQARALASGRVEAAQSYAAATRDFLAAHVAELAEQVAGRVARLTAEPQSEIPFYPSLARLAAEFCAQDLQYLSDVGRVGAAALKGGPLRARPALQGGSPTGAQGEAVALELRALWEERPPTQGGPAYDLRAVRSLALPWDRVVKSSHLGNCWYQRACNFNLFVYDGVVLREEQAGNYPSPNDPSVPDANPRGCQKGVCYANRTYDPARLKYPLKRAGERGEGRWQRLSWDQALAEIADLLIDVLATDGPDAIFQPGGTQVYSQASEGMGANAFFEALGAPLPSPNVEIGDDHQGAAVTAGKIVFSDSADNWFHADVILVWGGNPGYTNVPNYHYISEARYRGARVITIAPDYNASAVHADLWVPLNIGTDAALALSMCQVIVREGLFKADFVREQTDLPLLVREDTARLLRERDLKRGGREDIFYLYDQASAQVVEAPRKSLALNGLVPALEGSYEVETLQGPVRARPVFELLRDQLNSRFTPELASGTTGVPASQIETLAREVATAGGVVNISTSGFGKFYHGDLIERAMMLVFALCGHMGRKGATYSAFPFLFPDTALGALERHGKQTLQAAASADPRYAAWRADGYTTEMILNEYTKQAVASGAIGLPSMVSWIHGGLLEQNERHPRWDPYLKRTPGEYMAEALARGWQVVYPAPEKEPRILVEVGGNIFRRSRATDQLMRTLLPKLKLVLTVDWRMSGTALYSDYVLPACGWYERTSTSTLSSTQSPYLQVLGKAVDPLYESLSDWTIFVRLARAVARRARERGVLTYRDKDGRERRLDKLEEAVTFGGLYEEDEEDIARDAYVNSGNAEPLGWEGFKERGIAAFTSLGTGVRSLGNACDLEVGEPLVPLTWHTQNKQPYPTLTRRLQFYIDQDLYLELDEALPTHKDPPMAGGDYPLQLTGGHARWTIHSNWVDDALMLALQRGEPAMFMNAQDVAVRGICDGDSVDVSNDVGAFRVQAVVSPAVRPGQVIIYHGWENYQFRGWQHFKTVQPTPLNPIEWAGGYFHIRPGSIHGQPGLNDRGTRVEVRRAKSGVLSPES
ncbi:MAG: molybdopterin-dependent oxidoreductase [Chloroflexi bacterium]|nr:molybdopterin-dependent oxidoreductase [Chloroflexota bacterium]